MTRSCERPWSQAVSLRCLLLTALRFLTRCLGFPCSCKAFQRFGGCSSTCARRGCVGKWSWALCVVAGWDREVQMVTVFLGWWGTPSASFLNKVTGNRREGAFALWACCFICLPACFSGLEIEGIFRRSANVTLVKEVQHRYNSGQICSPLPAFSSFLYTVCNFMVAHPRAYRKSAKIAQMGKYINQFQCSCSMF